MGTPPAVSVIDASAPARLTKLARKRLERFVTLFPKALVNDDPKTIHDLRVASRRLQQIWRILMPVSDSSASRKLLRPVRKARRAFSACRNLDVSLALVEKQLGAVSTAPLRQAWVAVRAWLEEQRAGEVAQARKRLHSCDLIDFIVRARARLEGLHQESVDVDELSVRLRDAFTAWQDALAYAQAVGHRVKAIHRFRLAGKRLRYRAESLAAAGDGSVKRLIQTLKTLQDDLGDWHDQFVLRRYVAEFIGRPGFLAEEPGMCRSLLLEMERGKQRDHMAISELIDKAGQLAEEETKRHSSEPLDEKTDKAQ